MIRLGPRIAVALLLAAGATLVAAPSAQAFTATDPVITITQTADFPEGGEIEMALECPTGSTYGQIILSPATQPPFAPVPYDDFLDGTGQVSWIVDLTPFTAGVPLDAPEGMNIVLLGSCYTDDTMATQVGGTYGAATLVPSWGMNVSTAASTALGDQIEVTADCGTPAPGFVLDYFDIVIYDTDGTTPLDVVTTQATPGPITSYPIGTPTSLGFVDGDTIKILVSCLGSYNAAPDDTGATRYTTTVARERIPAPDDPGDPELAATGSTFSPLPLVGALALIVGGAIALALSPRRRQRKH